MDNQIYNFAQLWSQVLVTWYNSITTTGVTKKRLAALLQGFYALKATSKFFFYQLDDNFFNEVIFGHSLKHLKAAHTRHVIQSIIKTGIYQDLVAFLKLGEKWNSASLFMDIYEKSLPIVAQYSDADFMSFFIDASYFKKLKFSKRTIVTAMRRANEREDRNEMLFTILPKLLIFCHLDATLEKLKRVSDALRAGKKLHFDNVIGFDEKFDRQPSSDLILELLDEKPAMKQLLIPEGDLWRANKLGSRLEFKKYFSNFSLKNRSDSCTIKFRHRNSTQHHEISITKNINDGVSGTYKYEDVETDNLYQLITKTSLFNTIFGSYLHPFVAVTYDAIKLPLEEQPWFLGNISDSEKFALVSEAPNTSVFFTYSRDGNIYLVWTNTPVSHKNSGLNQTHVTRSIEQHLPRDKFILGVFNNWCPVGLAEQLAARYVLRGDFKKAKKIILDNKIDLAKAFNPNIVLWYLTRHPKEKINNKMIIWLMENHAPSDKPTFASESSNTVIAAIEKCSEEALIAVIQNSECPEDTLLKIFKRGGSYDLLKEVYLRYKASSWTHRSPKLVQFLSTIQKDPTKFKVYTYTKRILITLAWQFGNNDNYFKFLPRELLDQILEDVDEPAYFQFIEFLMEHWVLDEILKNFASTTEREAALALFLPFFWKNWDRPPFSGSPAALQFVQHICFTGGINIEPFGPVLRHWLRKILNSEKFTDKFEINASPLAPITYYCLTTPTSEALSMLKILLERQLTTKSKLLQLIRSRVRNGTDLCYPATWLAVDTGYLPTIKFLLEADLLPETVAVETNPKKLSDLYARRQRVKEFIEKYRKENKK